MLYLLLVMVSRCFDLDFILYKRVRIRSIPYSNIIITERISDFSKNVFYSSDVDHLTSDNNDIARIEKVKGKYKIKIGNFYICKGQTWKCSKSSNDKVCIDNKNNEIDCETCRMKALEHCENDLTLWDIERTALGYVIKYKDKCITLGHRIKLQTCKNNKDQLFGFEDYELISCLLKLGNKGKPENYKDLLDKKKLDKLIEESKDPAIKKALKKNKKKKNSFDEFVNKEVPSLRNKPKMKKLWGNLWDLNYNIPKFDWDFPDLKFFCTKWW